MAKKQAGNNGKRGGQRPALDEKTRDEILLAVRTGNYLDTAIAIAGVCRKSFYDWLRRGKREQRRLAKDGGKPLASEARYLELHVAVVRALAESEAADLSIIAQAARGGQETTETRILKRKGENGKKVIEVQTTKRVTLPQWQASAWRLERRFPQKYGRRINLGSGKGSDSSSTAQRIMEALAAMDSTVGKPDEK